MRRILLLLLLASAATTSEAWVRPAHASLFRSMQRAIAKVSDVLPKHIRLGPSGVVTQAQRDSVRRTQLARLARMSPSEPLAGITSTVFVRHGLDLTCWIADSISRDLRIHRRDLYGHWRLAGKARGDRQGQVCWRDSTALRGQVVQYTLELRTPHGIRLVLLPAITIPGYRSLNLAAQANAAGEVTLVVELPDAQTATLDLFDVAGRHIGSVDLSGCGVGRHVVPVPRSLLPSRGVYFARLQQAGEAADAKLFFPR